MMKTENPRQRVFISRNLDDQSPFKDVLKLEHITIDDQSLIEFEEVPFLQPNSEWLFFYSKTGIKFFKQGGGKIKNCRIATFGKQTAVFFENMYNQKPDFIGSGIKEEVTQHFTEMTGTSTCLFVLGKNSMRSVQKLRNNPSDKEIVVYLNTPRKSFDIVRPDIAVFTSPMSVETYFDKYKDRNHHNIAIGESTLNALKKITSAPSVKSNTPSEQSLAKMVKESLIKS